MKGRFETLLKVARLKEDAIKREIGQIETHLQAQEERLAFIRRLAEERTRDLDESRNRPTGLSTLQLYQNFFSGIKQEEGRQQAIIDEIARRRDETRTQFTAAARKRRTFEILMDREILAHKKELAKREIALLDEAATNQWRKERLR
jgi:flagellar export protein FliJ